MNEEPTQIEKLSKTIFYYQMRYNTLVDQTTPYKVQRWVVFAGIIFIFLLRVFLIHKWYLVTYALGIYLLNIFLAFLTPKFIPSIEMESLGNDEELSEERPSLPTRRDDEFRPFIRRLPEFKFWYNATRATTLALMCTLTDATDIPVFWPILLVYFIFLVMLTMKRQIRHMIKYNYVPFDLGKKKYAAK